MGEFVLHHKRTHDLEKATLTKQSELCILL
jgi:hypothetical protein